MVMKKIFLSLFFVAVAGISISAQEKDSKKNDCTNDPVLNNVQWLNDKILINNKIASTKDIKDILQKTSPRAGKMYFVGQSLSKTGTILLSAGGGLLVGGGVCLGLGLSGNENKPLWITGAAVAGTGAIGMLTSVHLFVPGSILKKVAIRHFKQNCLSEEPFKPENKFQINLNVNNNGLGLAFVF